MKSPKSKKEEKKSAGRENGFSAKVPPEFLDDCVMSKVKLIKLHGNGAQGQSLSDTFQACELRR